MWNGPDRKKHFLGHNISWLEEELILQVTHIKLSRVGLACNPCAKLLFHLNSANPLAQSSVFAFTVALFLPRHWTKIISHSVSQIAAQAEPRTPADDRGLVFIDADYQGRNSACGREFERVRLRALVAMMQNRMARMERGLG